MNDADPFALICTSLKAKDLLDEINHESNIPADSRSRRQVMVSVLERISSGSGYRTLQSAPWAHALGSGVLNTSVPLDPGSPAYILYTSGSTGQPKGVVHSHDSAMAFVRWATRDLELGTADVLSQHASPSFDLTVFDFFGSVMAGATLVPVPETTFGQVAKIYRFIVQKGITVWYSVPSALLRDPNAGGFSALSHSVLRKVVFAGEVIPVQQLKDFIAHLPPSCTVSNWYGPTETNVCTFYNLTTSDLESQRPVPIGVPCPYAKIHIAPQTDYPTTPGSGELLVASPTVMEGYWQRDDLTAAAFWEHTGRAYYRTGDLVMYDNRHQLMFLGRRDRLIKIRGYRIQPEEVEAVLRQHADVIDAKVVVIRQQGVETLAAAVVIAGSGFTDFQELRSFCADRLPVYMVPSQIMCVDALPVGNRGKVDMDAVFRMLTSQSRTD
jgi:amino acid adenylation domain-containing protein